MKKIMLASVLLIISCKEEKKTTETREPAKKEVAQTTAEKDDSNEAKIWLEKAIVEYFKDDAADLDLKIKNITTADYYEYKMDAMNVDMEVDGSLTKAEFDAKWKNKFDTSKAGIDSGFLISGQDWVQVSVGNCHLISKANNEYTFNVMILDEGSKAKYPREIKVKKEGSQFLIADVVDKD